MARELKENSRQSYRHLETFVPKLDEADSDMSNLRKEFHSLLGQLKFSDIDINDEGELNELYTLLSENYVEDGKFRMDYSHELLRWALGPPGYRKQWHLGVRATVESKDKKGKLLAFIAAIPITVRVYSQTVKMVKIDFLCVHKGRRSQKLTPGLIKEITRRVNLAGISQAAFTAGITEPKPIAQCRNWHRSLNPRKLINVGFSNLKPRMTLPLAVKFYNLPDTPKTPGLIPMETKHVNAAFKLLTKHLTQYDLVPVYTKEEFAHFFLPRPKVVYTYVVEKDGKVTDFISFYSLPWSIMNHPKYKMLHCAYSFYNVATSVNLVELVNDGLILAKKEGFDDFVATDFMENKGFLEKLRFDMASANLLYHLCNCKCPDMKPQRVGLVLQ
ncbi:hypothetical protein QR680_019073 [Steinernema hermaphroditum]|uniref:Glycylpeptide N-tetradecanoyltransferase n=1 Tax=Steinernema hermaphroditum TaxID=289476 RepID=A0AA39HKU7_9BILA|nr:hypothetical protein QR680_019073 [Steinernema hermaphroditum]